jgi:hypothetical protein
LFEFFVVWVVQDRLIEVSHQVKKALLLRTRQRIVCGVEIRH